MPEIKDLEKVESIVKDRIGETTEDLVTVVDSIVHGPDDSDHDHKKKVANLRRLASSIKGSIDDLLAEIE